MEIHVSGDARMRNNPKANRLKSTAIEMQVSNDTKTSKYLEAVPLKSTRIEQHVGKEENRPKNLKANILPTEGYGLEVDGRVKSQYETAEAAAKAGLELKRKYPQIQVKVFDAKERTRTAVELSAQPDETK
jgi:hypothetical protein